MANEKEEITSLKNKIDEQAKQLETLSAEFNALKQRHERVMTFVNGLKAARNKIQAFRCEINKAYEDENMALIGIDNFR